MLDRVLDRLQDAGVQDVVLNQHYRGEMIAAALEDRKNPRFHFSPEQSLLDTGGGVRKALAMLGDQAFFVVNGDIVWLDGRTPALRRLAEAWDEAAMDVLLLLHPVVYAIGYPGAGDFFMDPLGRLTRRGERQVAPFVFAGIQILHPRLFEATPEGRFSLNLLYDRAAAEDRLRGLRHDGEWFHVGTPEDLAAVTAALRHNPIHTNQR